MTKTYCNIFCNNLLIYIYTSQNEYSETDIIRMVEFVIDNIYVEFGGHVYQLTVGIPMGINCAPLVADLFLYSYEALLYNIYKKSMFKKQKNIL